MRTRKFDSIDRSYYPVADGRGRSGLQSCILHTLLDLFVDYFRHRGHTAFVCCNQFFYYRRGDPRAVVDPDLYIVDDETRRPAEIPNWKTWTRDGKVPTLALELVDDEYPKTYGAEVRERYEQLGVRELIHYDPEPDRSPEHMRFTHYLRDVHGCLVQQPCAPDRIHSRTYDLWLVRQPDSTLRIATSSDDLALWPTAAERLESMTRARIAAEARALAAEAELARLRGK